MVHDLEGAAELYARAGFIVGPQTDFVDFLIQRDIQVPGFYLSLMSPPVPPTGIPVLTDPAVAPRFAAVHLDRAEGDPLHTPDEGELTGIGFDSLPNLEHVPDAALQRHPNTVTAVAGVVIVAKNPSDHHIFLSAFTGQRELRATSAGVTAPTGRGELNIMDPTAFRGLFGVKPPDPTEEARVAAVRFSVRDRATLVATLHAGAIPFVSNMSNVVIAPQTALGATVVFEGG
jgi:hypothetical protein